MIVRRGTLPIRLACLVLVAVCSGLAQGDESESRPPNVVVFLADDAGWGDFGPSGNEQDATPTIDALARSGVSLDRFFVCPVCAPTRGEFLTGRYHPRGDVRGVSTGQERLNLDETTIADTFRAAGYTTGAFGKWHNGTQYPYHPIGRGFDEYFGHTAGHWGEYFDAPLEQSDGSMVRTEGYIVDVCTDRAIEFIEENQSEPFFCYVPFTTPHSPWTAPEEDWERFRDREITQRATRPEQEDLDHTRCALAMLANQDRNVGRVLDQLDSLDLSDDTIVVYFSDNGPNSWRYNGGMKGRKGSTDEGGIRSVCYMRWPGKLPAGKTVEPICGAIDLLPTLTTLAGVPLVGDKPLDGVDLTPLLRGEAEDWPERMIFSTWAGRVSVRTPTHRLDNGGKLFDMVNDPGQTVSINDRQPELAKKLVGAVEAWKQDVGLGRDDGVGRREVDPRPFPVGHPEFPLTQLPARDGTPLDGVKRSSRAPNCSYFVDWTDTEGRMVWDVDVQTAGRYEVSIDYTCPVEDAGSTIELAFGDSRLAGKVSPGWDPPLYDDQDTLPRPPAESQMKPFRTLELGQMSLEAGSGAITLRALEVPGDYVMDVRRVKLKLVSP